MTGAIRKLIREPRVYVPKAAAVVLQTLCRPLQNSSFFLQGQMDIHPKSRWRTPFINQLVSETGGFYPHGGHAHREICNLDPHDNTRRDMLILLLRTLLENDVPGAFAELGVYQGLTSRLIHHYAPERTLHLFDTFEGFTERNAATEMRSIGHEVPPSQFSDTSIEKVRRFIRPRADSVRFHPGSFPDSVPAAVRAERFAFVHLDADLYESTWAGLEFFYPRVSSRGIIVAHDYNSWLGARRAVDEFFQTRPERPIPMPDKSGSALIVKS